LARHPAPRQSAETTDVIIRAAFVWITTMTQPACPHKRTQLIAKDNDAQYVECLDCGQILEAGEMEKKEGAGFDESLSDA
jgi:hypothetical protein